VWAQKVVKEEEVSQFSLIAERSQTDLKSQACLGYTVKSMSEKKKKKLDLF
jgi:hypothetical protein